jgi:hypothetical protein
LVALGARGHDGEFGTKRQRRTTGRIGLTVDQDQVGPDVAIAVIAPLAAKQMVEITARQRLVL